jgi:hypothetical protein
MQTSLERVRARIAHQKNALPEMYGDVDFAITPERFTDDPALSVLGQRAGRASAHTPPPREMIERVRAYTMLGDVAADAYAARMPEYPLEAGFPSFAEEFGHPWVPITLSKGCEQSSA